MERVECEVNISLEHVIKDYDILRMFITFY